MRIVAAAVLVLGLAGVAGAQADDPGRYDCPSVQFSADAGPSVVVASTFIGVALRYELARADRVCTRRRDGREERLRSFPIRGTARPRGPARNRAFLALEDTPFDIDTSTATSVLLPETDGLPSYACYRLLSDNPAARLCLPSDLDGSGQPAGKGLFCNRGRCRERKVLFVSAVPDLYQGAWDATVELPGIAVPVGAVVTTTRRSPGRLAMDVVLGTRDALGLAVKLRSDGHLRLRGERQTGTDLPVPLEGTGRYRDDITSLEMDAELTSAQGLTTLSMRRTDADATPTGYGRCWLLTMQDGTTETTLRILFAISTNGLGASRPAEEIAGDGGVVTTLQAGDCAVTKSGRLVCEIPASPADVRLAGTLALLPALPGQTEPQQRGEGVFAIGATGRVGTWTAAACPAS